MIDFTEIPANEEQEAIAGKETVFAGTFGLVRNGDFGNKDLEKEDLGDSSEFVIHRKPLTDKMRDQLCLKWKHPDDLHPKSSYKVRRFAYMLIQGMNWKQAGKLAGYSDVHAEVLTRYTPFQNFVADLELQKQLAYLDQVDQFDKGISAGLNELNAIITDPDVPAKDKTTAIKVFLDHDPRRRFPKVSRHEVQKQINVYDSKMIEHIREEGLRLGLEQHGITKPKKPVIDVTPSQNDTEIDELIDQLADGDQDSDQDSDQDTGHDTGRDSEDRT
jgi:hypothetical protein